MTPCLGVSCLHKETQGLQGLVTVMPKPWAAILFLIIGHALDNKYIA